MFVGTNPKGACRGVDDSAMKRALGGSDGVRWRETGNINGSGFRGTVEIDHLTPVYFRS